MPILSIKDNPPIRNSEKRIDDPNSHWWVAKVKSRQEKKLAFEFLEAGIEYYLPMYSKKTKDAKKASLLPLFPSYVPFVYQGSPYEILQSRHVATIIPVESQVRFREQLQVVWTVDKSGVDVKSACNYDFKKGEVVRVVEGPLEGYCGEILKFKFSKSLVINLDCIGAVILSLDCCENIVNK